MGNDQVRITAVILLIKKRAGSLCANCAHVLSFLGPFSSPASTLWYICSPTLANCFTSVVGGDPSTMVTGQPGCCVALN